MDNKKCQVWATSRGLQLPKLVQSIPDNNIVLQKDNIVNSYNTQNSKKDAEYLSAVENGDMETAQAVVRLDENKKYYKVHRILMPDGSLFVLENKSNNAGPAGAFQERKVASPTDAVTNNNVSQNEPVVNSYNTQNSEKDYLHTYRKLQCNRPWIYKSLR